MRKAFFSVHENQTRLREAAISWVGTPFHENGRVKGPNGGVSCIGLIYAISREIGLIQEGEVDLPNTPIAWSAHNDFSLLSEFLRGPQVRDRVKHYDLEDGLKTGDLITLKIKRTEHHLCWLIEPDKLVHCHRKKGVMISDIEVFKPLMKDLYRIF